MRKPENLFQYWWWIALCVIMFASIASLITLFLPGKYQQSADIQILFEYSGSFYWSDKDMQSFTRVVGDLIDAPEITQTVLLELKQQGIDLTEKEYERFTQKQQRHYGWQLIVTTNDKNLTEMLISIWQATVTEAIEHDRSASLIAQQQEKVMDAWISCIQQLPAEPMHSYCNFKNASSISTQLNESSDQYTAARNEIIYLKNFPPVYSVEFYQQENLEKTSILSKSGAILIGGLIGIIFSIVTIDTPWIKYINFKQDEA